MAQAVEAAEARAAVKQEERKRLEKALRKAVKSLDKWRTWTEEPSADVRQTREREQSLRGALEALAAEAELQNKALQNKAARRRAAAAQKAVELHERLVNMP